MKWQPTPVFFPGESPWTEEPDGLQSTGSQRVRHDRSNLAWTLRMSAKHILVFTFLWWEGMVCLPFNHWAHGIGIWGYTDLVFMLINSKISFQRKETPAHFWTPQASPGGQLQKRHCISITESQRELFSGSKSSFHQKGGDAFYVLKARWLLLGSKWNQV